MKFFNRNKFKKNKIKMIYDSDLVTLLKSINEYNNIIDKKIKCLYCNNLVTIENLQVILPIKRDIKFICSNIDCLKKLKNE